MLECSDENGEKRYPAGVARLPRLEIDNIIDQYDMQFKVKYELAPLEDNEYHGNLLFHEDLIHATGIEKTDQALILSALSKAVIKVEINGENTEE